MANFFEGLLNIAKHPLDEAKWMWKQTEDIGKPMLKGDFGEAFDQFKGSFGEHNKMMSENIAQPLGGHNKLTENPDAVAGAIIGGILAAPMMAGGGAAAGGGAGGTAGGAGAGAGGGMSSAGLGWQGGAQMGALGPTFTPSTAFGGAGAGAGGGTGAMGMSTAYAPTTAFGQAAATGGSAAGSTAPAAGSGFDWGKFAQMTKNLQAPEEQQQSVSMGAPTGGRWGGFDSKLYRNPILEQEYAKVYMQPTYQKLV